MRTNLTWLLAIILLLSGLYFTVTCGGIDVGVPAYDSRMDEPYMNEIIEPCTPENCECMTCHKAVQR